MGGFGVPLLVGLGSQRCAEVPDLEKPVRCGGHERCSTWRATGVGMGRVGETIVPLSPCHVTLLNACDLRTFHVAFHLKNAPPAFPCPHSPSIKLT